MQIKFLSNDSHLKPPSPDFRILRLVIFFLRVKGGGWVWDALKKNDVPCLFSCLLVKMMLHEMTAFCNVSRTARDRQLVQNELLSKKISCLITDHIILRGSRRRELNSFKSYITVCEMSTTRPSIVRCSSKLDRSKRLFSAPDARHARYPPPLVDSLIDTFHANVDGSIPQVMLHFLRPFLFLHVLLRIVSWDIA